MREFCEWVYPERCKKLLSLQKRFGGEIDVKRDGLVIDGRLYTEHLLKEMDKNDE